MRTQQDRQLQQQRSALAALAATAGAAGAGTGDAAAALSAAAAAAAAGVGAAASASSGKSAPDFVQVLMLAHQQLCEQQVAREGLQAKLSEAKAAIERKNVLIRWAELGPAGRARWRGGK